MSSFINTPVHFESVKEKLIYLIFWEDMFTIPKKLEYICPKSYHKRHYTYQVVEEEINSIFNTLKELQVLCVNLQYRSQCNSNLDSEIKKDIEVLQTKVKPLNLTINGLYKAVLCIEYQIEPEHLKELRELTTEEENALFFIREIQNCLAHYIVYNLEDYKKEEWSL